MKNIILDKSFEFALNIIEYAELLEFKRKFVIAKQILKSGTSIGANVNESQSAESRADFIHKLKIADKEANEVNYWLKLCKYSKTYPNPEGLQDQLIEIMKLLSRIISRSKKNNI